jgi:ATP sulfurylase
MKPQFLIYLQQVADKKEQNARMDAQMSDGGAKILRDQVDMYICGQINIIPTQWDEYYKQYTKELDPEYGEYLRLKDKFE